MNSTLIRNPARTGRSLATFAGSAVIASTVAAFTPSAASAFDLNGLIGTAIAIQMAQHYRGGSYGHARGHVASRHHEDSDDKAGNSGGERDARDLDANIRPSSQAAPHHEVAARSESTLQASVRDASANEPAFQPMR